MRPAVPLSLALLASTAACGGDSTPEYDVTEIALTYADLATQGYADSVDGAEGLRDALQAFVDAPSDETLEAARTAWKNAREPYRLTEALRFYGGPIDDPADEREGQ